MQLCNYAFKQLSNDYLLKPRLTTFLGQLLATVWAMRLALYNSSSSSSRLFLLDTSLAFPPP